MAKHAVSFRRLAAAIGLQPPSGLRRPQRCGEAFPGLNFPVDRFGKELRSGGGVDLTIAELRDRDAGPGGELGRHLAIDGDGGGVAVDPEDAEDAYGAQNGLFITTTSAGESWDIETTPSEDPPSAWRTAIDRDGSDVFTVTSTNGGFQPGPDLYRSTDDGDDFTLVHSFGAAAQSITVGSDEKENANLIWAGLVNGNLERTANPLAGNPTWTAIAGPVAGEPVSGIAVNPRDTSEVVITYEGFAGAPRNHVFLTRDNGATWNDISTNLIDLPTHSVVIDPGDVPTIIIANDAGVWQSTDRGASWAPLGAGLPMVDCRSLAIDYSTTPSLLRLGTYGRSVFELQ